MLSTEIRTRPVQTALTALGLVLSAIVVTMHLHDSVTQYLMDLDVFRDAGDAFVRHTPLYTEGFHTSSGFRFIYPPVAAFLFSALTVVGATTMQFLWTLGLIVLVWWVLEVALQRMHVERANLLATAALGLALCLEPIRSNFVFGQINIVLMALVVADCLGVIPKRFRGVGIALAAAVKITPAAFGLLLLLRRDLPSVARAAGGFVALAAFGYWLRPESSVYFWTHEAWATDRAGDQEFFRNQALTGLIARFDFSETVTKGLWVVGAVVIVAAAAWAANRFLGADEPVLALGVIALATLLAAPIAVTHHWAYSVLLIAIPLAPQYRHWWPVLLPAALVFLVGPNYLLVDAPSHGWVEQIVLEVLGNSQCLAAIVLLIAAVVAARSRRESEPTVGDAHATDEAVQPQSAPATT
ncbi:MAG: glycosyltransferase family 87 protein [Rhodococcus sp. (in: high G+C Gram-positive bacteria)]|uniref:glycosyltransferase family 87 protein n=1 Tax=Rhodococcus sp. TaxID=1831 RepID=UPI003BB4C8BC